MPKIEMIVSLKVPDNVAITAFNALKRMGYKLIQLQRSDYYKFDMQGNVEDFKKKISNTDILVNSNKNKFSFSIDNNKKNNYKKINILVQDLDNGAGLLSTLKERLGFGNIKKSPSLYLIWNSLKEDVGALIIVSRAKKDFSMSLTAKIREIESILVKGLKKYNLPELIKQFNKDTFLIRSQETNIY